MRVTRWLVEKAKAKVNAVDRFGSTPLACAARSRHTAIVQVLIKAGGKVLGLGGGGGNGAVVRVGGGPQRLQVPLALLPELAAGVRWS